MLLSSTATAHPSIAQADVQVGEHGNGWSVQDERYLVAYKQAHKAGFDVGANLLESAWSDVPPVSDERIAASTATLQRWLNPEPVAVETVAAEPTYSEPTAAPSSGAPLSSIAACESGGDYGAVDPSGTYWGAYQFDAATWGSVSDAPYGSASPAEQDAAAAALYAQRGAAPWPVCGS